MKLAYWHTGTADNDDLEPALDDLPYTILAYGNDFDGPMNMGLTMCYLMQNSHFHTTLQN